MKTYREFRSELQAPLDENVLYGIAIERKLKAALQAVKSTNDTNKKIDVLMKSLHFSIGSIALNLTAIRKRK